MIPPSTEHSKPSVEHSPQLREGDRERQERLQQDMITLRKMLHDLICSSLGLGCGILLTRNPELQQLLRSDMDTLRTGLELSLFVSVQGLVLALVCWNSSGKHLERLNSRSS